MSHVGWPKHFSLENFQNEQQQQLNAYRLPVGDSTQYTYKHRLYKQILPEYCMYTTRTNY